MRRAFLVFAVLGLAGSLWAADPIIGTWKLNIGKSKSSQLAASSIKEQIDGSSMVGTTFGHYQITGRLDKGGMGEVYVADDLNLNRKEMARAAGAHVRCVCRMAANEGASSGDPKTP